MRTFLRRLANPWIGVMLVLVVFNLCLVAAGNSLGYDGALSWGGFGRTLSMVFGGFGGLLVLLGVLLVLLAIYTAVMLLAQADRNRTAGVVALVFTIAAFVAAVLGVHHFFILPNLSVWPLVGFALVTALEQFIIWLLLTPWFAEFRATWRQRRSERDAERVAAAAAHNNPQPAAPAPNPQP